MRKTSMSAAKKAVRNRKLKSARKRAARTKRRKAETRKAVAATVPPSVKT
jgi:hypothetical protein